jgi:cysteine dioxygenase
MDVITLEDVYEQINEAFGKAIKLKNMTNILECYNGYDWREYINFCEDRYTRNKVLSNEIFEILIICWNNNQKSPIHDHPEKGCLLKILEGILVEKCFDIVDDVLTETTNNILIKDKISYQEGSFGLHEINNPQNDCCSISLHVYSPPNYVSNCHLLKN